MSMTAIVRRLVALSFLILFSAAADIAKASEVKVMISGGLTAAYKELVPQFERATGNTVSRLTALRWVRRRTPFPCDLHAERRPTCSSWSATRLAR